MEETNEIKVPKTVTRLEVIDKKGRSYTNYDVKHVEVQLQDDEKTIKIFIS